MSQNVPSVDQSDRRVPVNLRQSGLTPVQMLIDTRVRKSPYWHLSVEAGCWRASVYNRMYHPRGYVRPEDGGAMAEYDSLVNHVTMWNVAVERQIQVIGPDAAEFVNFVITRDATRIPPMRARYVILCNEAGGVLNDPVLLRIAEDEYWFSLSDSDLMFWLQGVNVGRRFDVDINEIDVSPVQIQGPKSVALMADLFGPDIADLPPYGLHAGSVAGCDVIVSQTGFSGEKGYEIYLRDATLHAEAMWNAVLEAGQTAPARGDRARAPPPDRRRNPVLGAGHGRRDAPLPGEPRLPGASTKASDYIGKTVLEAARAAIEAGNPPFTHTLVGHAAGRQADRRLRRPTSGWSATPRRATRSGTSPRRGSHPSSRATSPWATCPSPRAPSAPGCGSTSPTSTPRCPGPRSPPRWSRCRSGPRSIPTSVSC